MFYLLASLYRVLRTLIRFGLGQAILTQTAELVSSADTDRVDEIVFSALLMRLISLCLVSTVLSAAHHRLDQYVEFDRGFDPLLFLTGGAVVFSIYQPVHQTFYALNRLRTAFLVSAVTSLSDFSLNILLRPPFGIAGAGISTAASMCLSAVAGLILLRQLGFASPLPFRAWRIQIGAAVLMALVVRFGDIQVGSGSLLSTNVLITVGLTIYGCIVLAGDTEIRNRLFSRLGSLTAP